MIRELVKHIQEDKEIFKPASKDDLAARTKQRDLEDAKARETFLKNPLVCPYCGATSSADLDYREFDGDHNQVWQNVHCEKCDHDWSEIYTLTDFEANHYN